METDKGTVFSANWFMEGDPITSIKYPSVELVVMRKRSEDEFFLDVLTWDENEGWVDHRKENEPIKDVVAYFTMSPQVVAYKLGLEYKEKKRREAEKLIGQV